MFLEAAYIGFLLGDFVYHRWFADKPPETPPVRELTVPRTDEGACYPLVYGRCLVEAPVMVWAGTPSLYKPDPAGGIGGNPDGTYKGQLGGQYYYEGSMTFVVGIPFVNGFNRIYNIYVGEKRLNDYADVPIMAAPSFTTPLLTRLSDLTGDPQAVLSGSWWTTTMPLSTRTWVGTPAFEDPGPLDGGGDRSDSSNLWIEGSVEFLNGNLQQELVVAGSPVTVTGRRMMDGRFVGDDLGIDPTIIPGYRRRMCVTLTGIRNGPFSSDHFQIGSSPNYPNFRFDVASYPEGTGLGGSRMIGSEANPADVLYDLLTSPDKLGLPFARVDIATFTAVAIQLNAEAHGYSRAYSDLQDARTVIDEICQQIDAVMYEDPTDLLIKIKLVRGDYDPAAIPDVRPSNCAKIENLAMGGWANVVNKVRVVYKDRQENYRDNSATAHNMANAVGQDGLIREVVLQMPGVCTKALAEEIAKREISARSRPIMKCRVTLERGFRQINPGDVISITHAEYNLAGVIFRVAGVERGTLEDGQIKLDLIQDFFYQRRGTIQQPIVAPFPTQSTSS